MKEFFSLLFPKREQVFQVTTWLESGEMRSQRRYVALLNQTEISHAKAEFTLDKKDDSCWGDRAFELYPHKFFPR